MFDRERYLEAILGRLEVKTGEDDSASSLADVVLYAEVTMKHQQKAEPVDVLDGLRSHAANHVLLLGKPGSGKTTALRHLLREEAEKCLQDSTHPIPVLLELRRLDVNTTIDDLLAKILSIPCYRVKAEDVIGLLDDNPFLVLCDGLNELPPGSHGLTDWRKDFSHIPMIFTSRELGTETYLGIKTQLRLLPLTDEQCKEFIEKRLGRKSALKMLQALHGRIKELTDSPLLLDMLCSTYQEAGNIPQNRGELFRQFTQDKYREYKAEAIANDDSVVAFRRYDKILQEIAHSMMNAEDAIKLEISHSQAEEYLKKYFPGREDKVEYWLNDVLRLHLLQLSANKSKVEFTHQLFQEYYATERLLSHLNELSDDQLCAYYLNPTKWTESILMLMDLITEESQAKRILELALGVDITLAAQLSGRVKKEWQELMFNIFYSRVKGENISEYMSIKLMEINRTEYAINKIIPFLENNQIVSVCEQASEFEWLKLFEIIMSVECASSLKYLIDLIKIKPDHHVLVCTPEQYNHFEGKNFNYPIYVNGKFEGKEPEIRNPVVNVAHLKWQAMSTLWRWEKFDIFIEYLPKTLKFLPKDESDYRVIPYLSSYGAGRDALLEITKLLGKQIESLDPLMKPSIKYHGFLVLRRVAVESLGYFIDDIEIVEFLINLLDDRDYGVCCIAARILGKVNSEKAVEPLVRIVCNGIDQNVYNYDPNKINNGEEALDDTDCYNAKHLFEEATNSLGRIAPDRAEKEVLSLLAFHDELGKQILCIKALGIANCQKSMPILIEKSKDNNVEIRKAAIFSLKLVGAETEIQDLINLLDDSDYIIQKDAISALKYFAGKLPTETTGVKISTALIEKLSKINISNDKLDDLYSSLLNKEKDYFFTTGYALLPIISSLDIDNFFQSIRDDQGIRQSFELAYDLSCALRDIANLHLPSIVTDLIMDFFINIIDTESHKSIRGIIIELLITIPHYLTIEKWIEVIEKDEEYRLKWNTNNSFSLGSFVPQYLIDVKACKFSTESEKDRFKRAVNNFENYVGIFRSKGVVDNEVYATEFCRKENIDLIFKEMEGQNPIKTNLNIKSILNNCPNYWPRLIDWASNYDEELHNQLSILHGIHEHKQEYIEPAFSLLKNKVFQWKDVLARELEGFPECLEKIKTLIFSWESRDYNFSRMLQNSQNYHGYYSHEWFEKSKRIPPNFSEQNKEIHIKNYIVAQKIDHIGNINKLNEPGEVSVTSTFNFHGPVTAGVVGENHGTVNMNTLDAQDIQDLRKFLQDWKNHHQVQIIEKPEDIGINIAEALQHQKPSLWGKVKYRLTNGGVGASTSLLGDLAVGEDPMKAAIKACFAFISGAATSP